MDDAMGSAPTGIGGGDNENDPKFKKVQKKRQTVAHEYASNSLKKMIQQSAIDAKSVSQNTQRQFFSA
jgi:hypothetical protein